jgi:hypothetical protein
VSIADEIERLARLREQGTLTADEFARAKAILLSGGSMGGLAFRSVRRQSACTFCGLPLWSVAFGPDPARGEWRGHARGIFAYGDIATGWVACGGFARGIIALGGLAVGLVSFGGGAIGLLLAMGGGEVGGIALGGAALGVVAIGGGACGYYALGSGAIGAHALSVTNRDPAALEFFQRYLPFVRQLFGW